MAGCTGQAMVDSSLCRGSPSRPASSMEARHRCLWSRQRPQPCTVLWLLQGGRKGATQCAGEGLVQYAVHGSLPVAENAGMCSYRERQRAKKAAESSPLEALEAKLRAVQLERGALCVAALATVL